ncbi:nucleotidyltransferase domain-containing protein [Extibacter muris]|uniref:nucleotidyltransferase domain-containing protein n=1 Tax=Extibacter muris TaxID=1796622 RepID=UPI001D066288|nr:nucleotidyltransferase domain-containing protein [Extibacter muris]MCB6200445.1 nucleotidyltransferase domain-containing protein [Extibacter muris]MCQ4663444.1 nucleotidyltransferase domain-containing protein [Extibacter muris]MCQ4692868.1 nucleotidyltransferase domain-containing protein [Extibacter muris]
MENIQDIIVDFTRKVKEVLGANLSKIILYGSYARGEQRNNSDIDFMILTTLTEDEIEKIEPILYDLAFEFELNYYIDISVIVKNEEHYHYWLGALPFYNNIEREGVVLNG